MKILKDNEKTLIELVEKEVENLKEHATEEELNRLSEDMLDPQSSRSCVYGLMTGDCFSERANILITECAKKVYNRGEIDGDVHKGVKLNGKPKKTDRGWRGYWSPIEVYISKYQDDEDKKSNLIACLRGERETI